MRDFEVWIGECHLQAKDGGEEYRCQAAVWTDGYDGFLEGVETRVADLGYSVLWLENVLPAPQYLARNAGQQRQVGALAKAVHPAHRVELGAMAAVAEAGASETENYLVIKDHPVQALSDQSEVFFKDRDWIAPELKERLFGPSEDGAKMRTYLIVDATLRKEISGFFDLDILDLPVRCLFKGEAAEEMKEHAPYLVEMTLPDGAWDDNSQVPAFHRDFFCRHWGRNTGIFIRTTALMDEVWRHFRKFTLLPREGHAGRVFVRFWDEQYIRLYFPHIASNKDRVAAWFLRNGFCINAILADQQEGAEVRSITLRRDLFILRNAPAAPFVLTDYDLEPFYRAREDKDRAALAAALKQGFPEDLKNYSPDIIAQLIAEPVSRMRGYGFVRKSSLYLLAAWSLFLGKTFEQTDPTGVLLDICKGQLNEGDKMEAMKRRMSELSAVMEAAQ
ncbi:DUF4123 domain-containing protein [Thalassospira sp. TSL5-1]|uniref:DUF4123 domain-containing protein n=1 Tax=Thalassospira sp. TSL5-1 TaxID=1544451 RepID=UPI00094063BC|nr:DUF4123 domain-containing protein [Thalassospira sp. TSL5-1]OKH87069.1 hypothetical protein LF95_18930 [Thalassospira sp. TSL5-1]